MKKLVRTIKEVASIYKESVALFIRNKVFWILVAVFPLIAIINRFVLVITRGDIKYLYQYSFVFEFQLPLQKINANVIGKLLRSYYSILYYPGLVFHVWRMNWIAYAFMGLVVICAIIFIKRKKTDTFFTNKILLVSIWGCILGIYLWAISDIQNILKHSYLTSIAGFFVTCFISATIWTFMLSLTHDAVFNEWSTIASVRLKYSLHIRRLLGFVIGFFAVWYAITSPATVALRSVSRLPQYKQVLMDVFVILVHASHPFILALHVTLLISVVIVVERVTLKESFLHFLEFCKRNYLQMIVFYLIVMCGLFLFEILLGFAAPSGGYISISLGIARDIFVSVFSAVASIIFCIAMMKFYLFYSGIKPAPMNSNREKVLSPSGETISQSPLG